MIRSDAGSAHRLSLSARVVSTVDSQVKAKRQGQKGLWRLQNRPLPVSANACQRQAAAACSTAESLFYPGIIGWRRLRAACPTPRLKFGPSPAWPRSGWRCLRNHLGLLAEPGRTKSSQTSSAPQHPYSILVIILVAVVAGLIGLRMRLVALIVPEPSIDAIGGEQLRVRAALDRLAARYHDDLVHVDH